MMNPKTAMELYEKQQAELRQAMEQMKLVTQLYEQQPEKVAQFGLSTLNKVARIVSDPIFKEIHQYISYEPDVRSTNEAQEVLY